MTDVDYTQECVGVTVPNVAYGFNYNVIGKSSHLVYAIGRKLTGEERRQ